MLNLKTNPRSPIRPIFSSLASLRPGVFAFPLFLAAFLPRLAALGRYVTPDELTWVYRTINFRQALLAHDWANTIQAGHPGVITTWLGAIGVQLQLWLRPPSAADLDWLLKLYHLSPDNGEAFQHLAVFLTAARLGVILVTSLGIVGVYWLGRTRLGPQAALLGCLLLALDPFAAGLSGLLHVDALLATFSLLTLLLVLPKNPQIPIGNLQSPISNLQSPNPLVLDPALTSEKSQIPTLSQAEIPNPNLIPSRNPKSQPYPKQKSQAEIPNGRKSVLRIAYSVFGDKQYAIRNTQYLLAGITTALAILSKSPGVLLLAFVPAIILWPFVQALLGKIRRLPPAPPPAVLLSPLLKNLTIWLIACLLTILIFLPAVWADPGYVVDRISGLAERKVVGQNLRPDFFLGEVVFRPGLHFYPLALLFRLSPAVLIGLILLIWFFVRRFAKSPSSVKQIANSLPTKPPAAIPWLLLFSLAFLLFLNLSQRKFDRYTLPALLPLILVSAWPFTLLSSPEFPPSALRWQVPLSSPKFRPSALRGQVPPSSFFLPILLQLAFLVAYSPYPLTAYNWLAGGTAVARHVLPMGWGEDTSTAARWLAGRGGSRTAPTTVPLFTSNVPAAAPFYPGPVFPLTKSNLARAGNGPYYIALVTQDWQPNPAGFPVEENSLAPGTEPDLLHRIRFNNLDRALIYTAAPAVLDLATAPLITTPTTLRFNQALQISYTGAVTATWPDKIPLSIGWQALIPADYQLRLELRDPDGHTWDSRELPLLNDADQPARYWPAATTQPAFYEQSIPPDLPPGRYTITLIAYDELGAQMGVFDGDGRFAGTSAPLATLELTAPVEQPTLNIPNPVAAATELAGYAPLPTQVGTGEQLVLDLWWRAPAEPADSQLELQLGPTRLLTTLTMTGWRPGQTYHIRPTWQIPADLAAGDYPVSLQATPLGQIQVIARNRLFDLPAGLQPLNVQLGSLTRLQQATAEETADGILVRLIWQAEQPDGRSYTTFVHLRDANGQIISQSDRPPAEPTDTWLTRQVILDEFLLQPESGTPHTVAIGLYDPDSGQRLPVYTAAGEPLPDDQYLIEVTR